MSEDPTRKQGKVAMQLRMVNGPQDVRIAIIFSQSSKMVIRVTAKIITQSHLFHTCNKNIVQTADEAMIHQGNMNKGRLRVLGLYEPNASLPTAIVCRHDDLFK